MSLYTDRAPDAQTAVFSTIEPLSREYVPLTTKVGKPEFWITQTGIWTLVAKGRGHHDNGGDQQGHRICKPGELAYARSSAGTDGPDPGPFGLDCAGGSGGVCPCFNYGRGAFQAEDIVGCSPPVAPACFKVAFCSWVGPGRIRPGTEVTRDPFFFSAHSDSTSVPPARRLRPSPVLLSPLLSAWSGHFIYVPGNDAKGPLIAPSVFNLLVFNLLILSTLSPDVM
jgi:hypothetical protein